MPEPRHPLMESFNYGQVLIAAAQASHVEACLAALLGHEHGQQMLADRAFNDDGFWPTDPTDWRAAYRPYVVDANGILQIPVKGVLLHEFGYALGNWATGYIYIQRAFERGCADFAAGKIKGIALVENSPGGMVAGCFDACDKIYAAKQESGVPVRGFAHEMAYSAAYAIISLADHIAVSRTGGVGSIGVVTSHIDMSGMMDRVGIKRTWISAPKGGHKVDGNPDGPLPDDVEVRIQARIDELYEVFVSTVARNRPALSDEAIRATEALCFTATQALSEKLADSIGPLEDALVAFAADLSSTEGDEEMSEQDKAAQQAAIDAARAEGKTEGHAAGLKEGATAAVTRINAILGCEAAKDRPKAALSAALKTEMTAEQAAAFLADLPAEAPAAVAPEKPDGETAETQVTTDALSAAMAATGEGPKVGAAGKPGGESVEDKDDGSDIVALATQAGIKAYQPKSPTAA